MTSEQVLTWFHDYLEADRDVEVVSTRHGMAVLFWEKKMDNWSETDCRSTPETLFDFLLRSVQSYYKYLAIVDHEKLTKTDEKRIGKISQGYLRKRKETEPRKRY